MTPIFRLPSTVFLAILFSVTLSYSNSESGLASKLSELEAKAGVSPAREIVFREERYFPFRKKPVELEGVLRLWEGVGFSVFYPEKNTLMIADEDGILLRKFSKDGNFLQKIGGMGDSDTIGLLRAAFEFDREALLERFSLDWQEQADGWQITMLPKSEEEKTIQTLVLAGVESEIVRIDLNFAGKRRIGILPESETFKDSFSAEERTRYFRSVK